VSIPLDEIRQAHTDAKAALLAEVKRRSGVQLAPEKLTVGFARRATEYKRADLLFADIERLRRISMEVGPLQVMYAGKAHPHDDGGKALIHRVFQAARALGPDLPVVYVEGYDMALASLMCAGVDVWLNTPHRPMEASGTSGIERRHPAGLP
jgi:starch phosphorylase